MRTTLKQGLFTIAKTITIGMICLFFFFPIYWTVTVSFRPEAEYFAHEPLWVPRQPTFEHYLNIFVRAGKTQTKEQMTKAGVVTKGSLGETTQMHKFIANSVIVSLLSTALCFFLGVPCAYGLARTRMRGKGGVSLFILSTRMLPPIALIIPVFLLYRTLGLLDTRLGLALLYTVFNLSFAVWMMKGFFEDVPIEIEESAFIDGCSRAGALWRVVIPIAAPGIAAAMIFCLVLSWNEFLFAVILTRGSAKTLPVALAGFKELRGIMWGEMAAASMFSLVPLSLFAFLAQKYIISGLSFGGVKE